MSGEILKFTYKNIDTQFATEFGRIHDDAFKDDLCVRGYLPQEFRMSKGDLPPLADYEASEKKVKVFGKGVRTVARWIEILLKKDPRNELYLLRQKDTGKIVAASLWVLPDYVEVDKLSYFHRLCVWIREKYYHLLTWIDFIPEGGYPILRYNVLDEFRWASEQSGGEKTPERLKQLEGMSRKELEDTTYPKDLTYYSFIMVVRSDEHGKGHGRYSLGETKKIMASRAVRPPKFDGPAKFSLFSAPTAGVFYDKMGYSLGGDINHVLPDGIEVTHRYFFENVD